MWGSESAPPKDFDETNFLGLTRIHSLDASSQVDQQDVGKTLESRHCYLGKLGIPSGKLILHNGSKVWNVQTKFVRYSPKIYSFAFDHDFEEIFFADGRVSRLTTMGKWQIVAKGKPVAGRAFFPIVDNRGLMFGYTKGSVRKELHGRAGWQNLSGVLSGRPCIRKGSS